LGLSDAPESLEGTPATEAADVSLFGPDRWPLGAEVKLDPTTVDRVIFRCQRDRLKALGYRFHTERQCWLKETG
jgi:hypothetical protein